ncbi:hypothetical protein HY948_02045 [Candidatus Gottesmanbacteria bacterium]|nr:hypothetical protein [Candidatus Gottesmanbacteria bacterium]
MNKQKKMFGIMQPKEYEWPACWIRGELGSKDIDGDPVRQTVQGCCHRTWTPSTISIHGGYYTCHHPAVGPKEEIEGQKQAYGGLVVGTLSDDFATFCQAVDMHLTSLGEPSRLIPEGEFTVIEETEEHDGGETTFLLGSGR